MQLEIFLYGICLHLLDLPHLLFIPTPVGDYIALTAMSSIRLSDKELSKLATDDTYAKSRQNWMRSMPSKIFDKMV